MRVAVDKRKRERFEANHSELTKRIATKQRYFACIQSKYGLSRADYERLYRIQKGRCAICGLKLPRLDVDHCHVSGRVRGLLCGPCNTRLGAFREQSERAQRLAVRDAALAQSMIRYIEDRCIPSRRI